MTTIITVWVDSDGEVRATLDERIAIVADAADLYGGVCGKTMAVNLMSMALGVLEAQRDELIEAIAKVEAAESDKSP